MKLMDKLILLDITVSFNMASDRGQNRYSDFVALEILLRFENCSSSHSLLSSWRRFHVFESSHPSFHRAVFLRVTVLPPRLNLVSQQIMLMQVACILDYDWIKLRRSRAIRAS